MWTQETTTTMAPFNIFDAVLKELGENDKKDYNLKPILTVVFKGGREIDGIYNSHGADWICLNSEDEKNNSKRYVNLDTIETIDVNYE